MSPEREPMENDSNSRTAEELEQQTVDVYVERALHGPVFRMSYEHTHTYCEIFYLKSGTCTYTVNQGQWHLEAGDLFIVAAGDADSDSGGSCIDYRCIRRYVRFGLFN